MYASNRNIFLNWRMERVLAQAAEHNVGVSPEFLSSGRENILWFSFFLESDHKWFYMLVQFLVGTFDIHRMITFTAGNLSLYMTYLASFPISLHSLETFFFFIYKRFVSIFLLFFFLVHSFLSLFPPLTLLPIQIFSYHFSMSITHFNPYLHWISHARETM